MKSHEKRVEGRFRNPEERQDKLDGRVDDARGAEQYNVDIV